MSCPRNVFLVVILSVLLSTTNLLGIIIFNDGKEHIIQSIVNEAILIEEFKKDIVKNGNDRYPSKPRMGNKDEYKVI